MTNRKITAHPASQQNKIVFESSRNLSVKEQVLETRNLRNRNQHFYSYEISK